MSLTPSDSASNYEGRYQHQHHHQPSISSNLASSSHQRGASQSLFPRPVSPTADSTASFARQLNDDPSADNYNNTDSSGKRDSNGASMPLRPQRSMRRPMGMSGNPLQPPPVPRTGSSGPGHSHSSAKAPSISLIPPAPEAEGRSGDRHARSARMMAQMNMASGGRDTPTSQHSDDVEDGGLSPLDGPTQSQLPFSNKLAPRSGAEPAPVLGSLSQDKGPAALGSVLSALSQAGRKHQGRRILRGMTAEEESRRRQVEKRMDEARGVEYRDLSHYRQRDDEGGIGRIGAVHRKVQSEWGFVTEDDFNAVALALSLLDESSLGSNRAEFESTQQLIEESLQGTVDDHYESFATAITLHNSVLSSLTNVQTSVSSSRRKLRDSREALGSKRGDLVQLWHRQQSVKEALRLLQTVEQLKNVPDRLESLLSRKQFLTAVNLLSKALKAIDKPEIVDIGATTDLRTYLKSQEGHMLDILVEEIHNHLYLKSAYCDRRWRGYVPGEKGLPDVQWGRSYDGSTDTATDDATGKSTSSKERSQSRTRLDSLQEEAEGDEDEGLDNTRGRSLSPLPNGHSQTGETAMPTKLSGYLQSLSNRRVAEQSVGTGDLGDLDAVPGRTSAVEEGGSDSKRGSYDGETAGQAGHDADNDLYDAAPSSEFEDNAEADSFLYLEMLLEALGRLGRLGTAMDAIHQRLPVEIHALVETTIREVESRTEPLRRSSIAVMRPESILLASSSALAKTFGAGETGRSSLARSSFGSFASASGDRQSGRPVSTLLRMSAAESSQVASDGEVMRDLFWTLFSKLNAVLQGHRVIHDVASIISQRAGFKEAPTTAGSNSSTNSISEKLRGRLLGGEKLLDVWRPIQMEVRTLLHEYLMDDTQSTSSRRTNMMSINDVLKKGTFTRDKTKKLFSFSDGSNLASGGTAIGSSGPSRSTGGNASLRRELAPMKRHEDALNAALRASVPGLMTAAHEGGAGGHNILGLSTGGASSAAALEQQRMLSSTMAQDMGQPSSGMATGHHRLLVKPDAFNISVLFVPALAFVDRVRAVMPSEAAGETSKGFSSFLDEFVQDVFLPQLEDKVQNLFQSAVGGPNCFQEDPSSRDGIVSSRPIVKSAVNVVVLMDSLYSMLRTTPFHRESYSRLIIQTIVQFYSRCHDRFKELVAKPSEGLGEPLQQPGSQGSMLSAVWAQHQQLAQVIGEVKHKGGPGPHSETFDGIDEDTARRDRSEAQEEEIQLELQLASRNRGETVGAADVITSRKRLLALANLQHSLKWMLTHIARLKATDETLPVSTRATARLSVTSATLVNGATPSAAERDLKLPLSRDMVARFETLPRTYSLLADTVLFTLRLELRARVIHHLDLAVLEGNYLVDESAAEPDPHVVDLNSDLASLDDVLTDGLSPEDHRFLFDGLSDLMDTMLIASVRKIRAMNRPGVSKMVRNILALQQNLKNIVISDSGGFATSNGGDDHVNSPGGQQLPPAQAVSFDTSRRFWELLLLSPEDMLSAVQKDIKRQQMLQATAQEASPSSSVRFKYGFEELKCALSLMLGLDNVSSTAGGANNIPPSPMDVTPAASLSRSGSINGSRTNSVQLKPGTLTTALHNGSASATASTSAGPRQRLNEYLIELHQVLQHCDE